MVYISIEGEELVSIGFYFSLQIKGSIGLFG